MISSSDECSAQHLALVSRQWMESVSGTTRPIPEGSDQMSYESILQCDFCSSAVSSHESLGSHIADYSMWKRN